MMMFSLFRASSALRLSSFQSILPNRIGCRPMKMFSATDRLGQRLISWYTVLMPSFCAANGESGRIGLPSSRISPASCLYTPVRTFTRVDLPAPFWPMMAWTSPVKRRKSTPDSAFTPGKTLLIFRISRTGAASGIPSTSGHQVRCGRRHSAPAGPRRSAVLVGRAGG